MKDYAKMLARKGVLTVLERPGKKTAVSIQANGSIASLEGNAPKDQLLAELCQIVRNWPDLYDGRAG